ncbi:hypothetical protein HK101_002408 [Irineochytrium annulatum]|nr:hypothetical protein HK101_002408 [Irineochytrium annulatum]
MISHHAVLTLVIAAGAAPLLVSAIHHAPIHRKAIHISHRDPRQILSPRAAVPAPLTSYNDLLYTVPITLAQTGQKFNLDLDTGSSDTWIRGPKCKAADKGSECKGDKVDVATGVKNGLKDFGIQFGQVYGSGQVYAEIYEGTLTAAAGASATKLYFGVSMSESGFTNGSISDGILGLAFEYISNIGVLVDSGNGATANFFDQLGNKGSDNRFGIYLSTGQGSTGEITFGGVNTDRYTGTPVCLPLAPSTRGFWSFSIKKAKWAVQTPASSGASVLASGKLDSASDDAIVDTGSSLIYLDQDAADGINAKIGTTLYDAAEQLYVIKCSVAKTGPDVVFTIGKATLVIPASVYVVPFGPGTCVSGFTVGANDTIYDKNGSQTCFALANHASAVTSTTTTESPTTTTVETTSSSTTEVKTTEATTTLSTTTKKTTTKKTKTKKTTTKTTSIPLTETTASSTPVAITTSTQHTTSSKTPAKTHLTTTTHRTTTTHHKTTTSKHKTTKSTTTTQAPSVGGVSLTNTDEAPSSAVETDVFTSTVEQTVTDHVTGTITIVDHVTERETDYVTDRVTEHVTVTDDGTAVVTDTIFVTVTTEVEVVGSSTVTARPVYTTPPPPCPEESATAHPVYKTPYQTAAPSSPERMYLEGTYIYNKPL